MVTTSVNKRPKTRGGEGLETKVFYLLSLLPTLSSGRRRETLLLGESGAPNRALEGEREVQPIFLREIYIPGIVVPSSGDMEGVGSLVAMEINGVT